MPSFIIIFKITVLTSYKQQKKLFAAVDCIIFGFDGKELKLLLIKRGFEPEKGNWSLMGGFIAAEESSEAAASRIVNKLTGLENIYLEQLHVFSEPNRDPVARTISIAYMALINLQNYRQQLSSSYHAEWIPITKLPALIFDHAEMVKVAREKLKVKARHVPVVFEMLPKKFTIPQLQILYENIFDLKLDKRNFLRKIQATKLLVQKNDKDKSGSKRGAFYYSLNARRYKQLTDGII